ncbi:MAG: hypothetical protein M1834_004738 [Cirrosporium novae-zelandiae]|nr:MAG: hypothetical protein M1834_004738 [Cirrosporium novae-zelandiae]
MAHTGNLKSRNGCVKCDEVKPGCTRCINNAIECEYRTPLKWSTKNQPADKIRLNAPGAKNITQRSIQRIEAQKRSSKVHVSLSKNDALQDLQLVDEFFTEQKFMGNASLKELTSISMTEPLKEPDSDFLLSSPPLSRYLRDTSSVLVEYYFQEVAAVMSCYDSKLNPYRTTVARIWNSGSSGSIYLTIKSMAAVFLARNFPSLSAIGIRLRERAMAYLEDEIKKKGCDERSLLAMAMLGGTANWYGTKDFGISYYKRVRAFIESRLSSQNFDGFPWDCNFRFFQQSILYWEAFLSFMMTRQKWDNLSPTIPIYTTAKSLDSEAQTIPHPWSGVATDALHILLEVGKLVRAQRERIMDRTFMSQTELDRIREEIQLARSLEEDLLALDSPKEDVILNPGDDRTPVAHFVNIAEAYRCTALLQLYRVFPDLLDRRLGVLVASSSSRPCTPNTLGIFNSSEVAADTRTEPELEEKNTWMADLAIHILNLLKATSSESRTTFLQPLLMVAVSSELRLPKPKTKSHPSSSPPPVFNLEPYDSNCEAISISMYTINIIQARQFILSRLTAIQQIWPGERHEKLISLVGEIWSKMDGNTGCGDNDGMSLYWMDVMLEKNLEFG